MRWRALGKLALMILALGFPQAMASSLQVTPVRIQVELPAAASTITVSNPGDTPLSAQLRVFKWTRINGKDTLEATKNVVASPPLARLAPGQPYVVRIIRVSKTPIDGEETYRLLVDEIPNPRASVPSFGPRFAIRQSIPVFFTDPAAAPKLSWVAIVNNGRLLLKARNEGGRRVRISALNVTNESGASLGYGDNFIGYVFGRSSEQWTAAVPAKGFAPGGTITILAQGDNGPIKATAKIQAAN
ncbi:MAG: fimbrial biogenesis chaperone [Methylocella sp.]